ncbi:MAG: class I SAM-dependent methyltransferase [Acidobacteriota bacterium]
MSETAPYETADTVDRYEAWFENNIPAYKSELLAVKELLPENKTGIEIGVGTGRFSAPLGIKIGIDPSKEMGSRARKKGIHVIRGVAESLPLRNSSIDFLLMVTVICFLKDIKRSFMEGFRVLKPGGYFITGFVDRNSIIGRSYSGKKDKSTFYSAAEFYSPDEVRRLLAKTGFGNFSFVQTLFGKPDEIKKPQKFKKGYGEGSFVVLRGIKQ